MRIWLKHLMNKDSLFRERYFVYLEGYNVALSPPPVEIESEGPAGKEAPATLGEVRGKFQEVRSTGEL